MRHSLPAFTIALATLLVTPALAQPAPNRTAAPTAGALAWAQLSAEQRTALQPLAALWPTLQPEHQRKWIALAHNFERMAPHEQATLQSRMNEWAQLTPAQRTRARLNFGEARTVPADEKRSKWEEYQALPAEERDRLAREQPRPPAGAAPALRPAPPGRIVRPPTPVPPPGATAAPDARRQVPLDRNTLLPRQPADRAQPPAR